MKTLLTLLSILILSFTASGQTETSKPGKKDKPDFSGTWILDRTKTKKVDYDLTLIVVHQEPELKVTANFDSKGEKRSEHRIYYTDDRRLPDYKERAENVSQESRWAGRNIILETVRLQRVEGIYLNLKRTTTEKWKISEDGKTLTVEIIEKFPVGIPQPSRNMESSNLGDVTREIGSVKVLKFKRGEQGF